MFHVRGEPFDKALLSKAEGLPSTSFLRQAQDERLYQSLHKYSHVFYPLTPTLSRRERGL